MKINSLYISNILSFKYFEDISEATEIKFNRNLNLIIGENGSGKSTALEVLNFFFKRVIFKQYSINQEIYSKRSTIPIVERKQVLSVANNQSYSGFRLDPNWDSEDNPQKIKVDLELDNIDLSNIQNLLENKVRLLGIADMYSNQRISDLSLERRDYSFLITLNKKDATFSVDISPSDSRSAHEYLLDYNFYKELIEIHNSENPEELITPLFEPLVLIGGYRNYHTFNSYISLGDSSSSLQIQKIKDQEFSRSLNTGDQSEPPIFNLVRLQVAGKHYAIYGETANGPESEKQANSVTFLNKINEKLKLVNLQVKIQLTDKQRWRYSFYFYDTKRNRPLNDINSLSAGQKAIIHLVFEAYGRGDLMGGLVIIDEPEIHLHYQFQNEYLKIIEDINSEQKCQYILVTHSESLISSKTIDKVKRFTLDENGHTIIKSPALSTDEKLLVKILDNVRSTHAFFGKKVLLVEGEDDRYFFKALLQFLYPSSNQEIAILDIQGKPNYEKWMDFFQQFGLKVYSIGDLDNAFKLLYPSEKAYSLSDPDAVTSFKTSHPDLIAGITQKYLENIYILKNGSLEHYLGIHNKGLAEVIRFCDQDLGSYLSDDSNEGSKEIRAIFDEIVT